eukprot:10234942-Ditylum_brightwellii.AAC.1
MYCPWEYYKANQHGFLMDPAQQLSNLDTNAVYCSNIGIIKHYMGLNDGYHEITGIPTRDGMSIY